MDMKKLLRIICILAVIVALVFAVLVVLDNNSSAPKHAIRTQVAEQGEKEPGLDEKQPEKEPEKQPAAEPKPEKQPEKQPAAEPKPEKQPEKEKQPEPEKQAETELRDVRIAYLQKYNKTLTTEEAGEIVDTFESFAKDRDYIDTEVLIGLSRFESNFRADNGTNYIGLLQVSAKYGAAAGYTVEQLKTPYYNVKYAMEILDDLNNKLDGDLSLILTGYNTGYYALKNKLDNNLEISTSFYDKVMTYANQVREQEEAIN